MLRNYLRTAVRSMRRHRGTSFINIFGLSIGFAACMIIFAFVVHESRFDREWRDADAIYRITTHQTDDGITAHRAQAPVRFVATLQEEIPGIEAVGTVRGWPERVMSAADRTLVETGGLESDGSLLRLLGIQLTTGDTETALDAPFSVVLTLGLADKLFGTGEQRMGPEQRIDQQISDAGKPISEPREVVIDQHPYTVTGIVPDPPARSHLQYRYFVSAATRRALYGNELIDEIESNWRVGTTTYIKLAPDVDPTRVVQVMDQIAVDRINSPELSMSFELVPLPDIHLASLGQSGLLFGEQPGNPARIILLVAIALFILLLACVNFVNLATARASTRAREVGVRKVAGASRTQLVVQFVGEALMTSLLSLAAARVLVGSLLPTLTPLLGPGIDPDLLLETLASPAVVSGMVSLAVLAGILAGVYPALVLSSATPALVLKGARARTESGRLRRVLVGAQFVVSIGLIAATLVVRGQLDFISSRDLGYDTDKVVVIRVRDNEGMEQRYEPFKQELMSTPGVSAVTASTSFGALGALTMFREVSDEQRDFGWIGVDYNFVQTAGLHLIAGRDLSPELVADGTHAFLLNEKAARAFDWTPTAAIGQPLRFNGRDGQVVGVVRDFHQGSLYDPVKPMVMYRLPARSLPFIVVRLDGADLGASLAGIRTAWTRVMPDMPFEPMFLDERVQRFYEDDRRFAGIFTTSAAVAITLACLGLIGLAAFSAERRRKEIGVRKVLGASVPSLVALLSREFAILTGIAFAVATPLTRVALGSWLDRFAYRFTPSIGLFFTAGAIALFVALATVGWQSYRAASADPVISLRTDS